MKTAGNTASKTEEGLNLQQEAFCQLYVNNERELFGNGTQCYLEVYGTEYQIKNKKPMSYQVAMVNASNLLRIPKIIARINSLLETGGFNEENVDKQHLFLINQHADLKTKLGAIREFNALKSRIKSKLDLTTNGKEIVFMPLELVNKYKLKTEDATDTSPEQDSV